MKRLHEREFPSSAEEGNLSPAQSSLSCPVILTEYGQTYAPGRQSWVQESSRCGEGALRGERGLRRESNSELETHAGFNFPRSIAAERAPKERGRHDAAGGAGIGHIQGIVGVQENAELHAAALTGGAARPALDLLAASEAESFRKIKADIKEARAHCAVARDACLPVVGLTVKVGVRTEGDVVRGAAVGRNDRSQVDA